MTPAGTPLRTTGRFSPFSADLPEARNRSAMCHGKPAAAVRHHAGHLHETRRTSTGINPAHVAIFPLSHGHSTPMLRTMIRRPAAIALMSIAACLLAACGSSRDVPILAGQTGAAVSEGEALYNKAKAADDAGKASRAIKLYDRTATRYPFINAAAQARYRQAQLLEQDGNPRKAFDAYDKLLSQYPGGPLYSPALDRLTVIANDAAEGDIKSSFLGIRSRVPLEKTVEMLDRVRDHAPRSRTAAKARFKTGELYQAKKKYKEAIEAFRGLVREQPESPEAPEALFRVGLIYIEQADSGNQNQSNLDLANESFNDYLIQYPGHKRNAEARKMITSLRGMELERSMEIAEFYMNTNRPEAAKIYYRDIVRKSGSGKLHDAAKARLGELGE
jgi:outer membrane protein assembly factor BamD (BamD/ComL family)